ncbi:MAG: hypothetical protein M1343_01690 [Chloroflexi bacterium]|nr:hypothetical protein [Chloroflexota bacterium]MDA8188428.1 hypothetical protein [Dehalococcoidales bacterium]
MRIAVMLIVTILAIAALGIGGCASGASANNVLGSQPQLAAVKITGSAAAYPALEVLASSYKARVKGAGG